MVKSSLKSHHDFFVVGDQKKNGDIKIIITVATDLGFCENRSKIIKCFSQKSNVPQSESHVSG